MTTHRATARRLLLAVSVTLGAACSETPPPAAPTPVQGTPPQPTPSAQPVGVRHSVSGIVTNEAGSPMAAYVEIGFSAPPGRLPYVKTTTNASGLFEVSFEPVNPLGNVANASGQIIVYANGYQAYQQILPWGVPDFVRNVPLRPLRTITAGQSLTLSVEPDNSMCSDQEDLFLPAQRCEQFQIDAGAAGTLFVEARAVPEGGVVPLVISATSGRYHRQVTGPGHVSLLQVQAGESYRIFVGVPASAAPQSFAVSTSIQAGTARVAHR